jgi:hypothetical protein
MCLLLRSGFRLAALPLRPDWWSAAQIVFLLEGFPISTEELWSSVRVTIGYLVTSLPKALGRVLVVTNFRNDGGHCVLGDLQCCRIFLYLSPDLCLDTILSQSSTETSFDLMARLLLWHALSTVGPYKDRCVPFWIMSNQLNLPQVDSNWVVETFQWGSKETAQFRVS